MPSDEELARDTDVIRGRVTQIIPPHKHEDYMLGRVGGELADGYYVVVIDTRLVVPRLTRLLDIFRTPDTIHTVVADEVWFAEGDVVEVDVVESDVPGWYFADENQGDRDAE